MPWVRLDEEFPDHPKVVTAGPLAGWLHVCALAYCNRYLTDGFVSHAQVRRLADFNGITRIEDAVGIDDARDVPDVDPYDLATKLVDVGMWERRQGGYLIHDYLTYQPSRAEIDSQRKVKAEAGRLGGKRSGESRRSTSEAESKQTAKQTGSRTEAQQEPNGEANGQAKPKPDPVPDTEPLKSSSSVVSSSNGQPAAPAVAEEEEDSPEVLEASRLVAEARLSSRTGAPVMDRAKWLAKAQANALPEIRYHEGRMPYATAAELAQQVIGATKPGRKPTPEEETSSAEQHRRSRPRCQACSGSGWADIDDSGEAVRCPDCNPAGLRVAQ